MKPAIQPKSLSDAPGNLIVCYNFFYQMSSDNQGELRPTVACIQKSGPRIEGLQQIET
jgi:hypothetical protein